MSDVGPGIADVPIHLSHDANVLVAVQQRVLLVSDGAHSAGGVRGLVRLEARIGQDHDEALGVLVIWRDGNMLLCNQLRQGRRWQRLCPCR